MPYPRQQSNTWYLKRWPYRLFMLREFSSVFLAGYMIVLLVVVLRVHDGPRAYHDMVQTLRSPGMVIFSVIALLFTLLHTVTWFLAVPSALQLRIGEEKVPPRLVIAGAYGALLVVSGLILLVFLI
jgi:fumarate reductase subunit C